MSKRRKGDFTNKTYNNLIALLAFLFSLGFVVCKLFGILTNSWWVIIVPWLLVLFFSKGDDEDDDDEEDLTDDNNRFKMA